MPAKSYGVDYVLPKEYLWKPFNGAVTSPFLEPSRNIMNNHFKNSLSPYQEWTVAQNKPHQIKFWGKKLLFQLKVKHFSSQVKN